MKMCKYCNGSGRKIVKEKVGSMTSAHHYMFGVHVDEKKTTICNKCYGTGRVM